VIVRDAGGTWDIVLQTDHALLSGQFAAAWGNDVFAAPRPRGAVVTAAARHDDGWVIWERAPGLLRANGSTRPRNFLDVQIRSHLAFYRAQIAAVSDEDPYAGLLISMHARGLYNQRFGTDPGLNLTFADEEREAVDAFVAEQDAFAEAVRRELAVPDDELWTNYQLLQIYDRLSLYFCRHDLDAGAGAELTPVPVAEGARTAIRIDPAGPWRVRMDPYPFTGDAARFTLARRRMPKQPWASDAAFRTAFFTTSVQETPIVIVPA
jgi:hypothetical protein